MGLKSFAQRLRELALGGGTYGDEIDEEEPVFDEKLDRAMRELPPVSDPVLMRGERKERQEAASRKVVRMPEEHIARADTRPSKIVLFKPERVDEWDVVCANIQEGSAVALNLEKMDSAAGQRILDFSTGAVMALDGDIHQLSNKVFLVCPPRFTVTPQHEDTLRKEGIITTPLFKRTR